MEKNETSSKKTESKSSNEKIKPEASFGKWLKELRESKNVTLEEVASATKIQLPQLEHLENEHFDKLPPTAFVRGFLVNYSKFLDIDENIALEKFKSAHPMFEKSFTPLSSHSKKPSSVDVHIVSAPNLTANLPTAFSSPKAHKRPMNFKWITALVLVCIAGLATYFLVNLGGSITGNAESVTSFKETEKSADDASNKEAMKTDTDKEVAEETPIKVVAAAPVINKVEITALESSRMSVRVDKSNVLNFMLKKGRSKSYEKFDSVFLMLMDASSVKIKLNGKDYTVPAQKGEMKTLTLPNDISKLKE